MAIYEGDLREDKSSKFILNVNEIQEGTTYVKLMLVQSVKESRTEMGEIFYRFVMRDRNSVNVVGRLFRPPNDLTSEKVNSLKGEVVKCQFMADMFGGSKCLNIESIEKAPEVGIKRELFIGEVSDRFEITDKIKGLVEEKYSRMLDTNGYYKDVGYGIEEYVMNGKIGSKAHYILQVCKVLEVLASVPKDAVTKFVMVECIKTREESEVDNGSFTTMNGRVIRQVSKLLDLLETKTGDRDFTETTLHVAECLVGIDEPRTEEALAVCEAVKSVRKCEKVKSEMSGMTKGAVKMVDNVVYTRF